MEISNLSINCLHFFLSNSNLITSFVQIFFILSCALLHERQLLLCMMFANLDSCFCRRSLLGCRSRHWDWSGPRGNCNWLLYRLNWLNLLNYWCLSLNNRSLDNLRSYSYLPFNWNSSQYWFLNNWSKFNWLSFDNLLFSWSQKLLTLCHWALLLGQGSLHLLLLSLSLFNLLINCTFFRCVSNDHSVTTFSH